MCDGRLLRAASPVCTIPKPLPSITFMFAYDGQNPHSSDILLMYHRTGDETEYALELKVLR
jgi:hypothetical protein